MKSQVNPVFAGVVIVIALAVIGYFVYTLSGGKTFTKSEASQRLGDKMDFSKLQPPANMPK